MGFIGFHTLTRIKGTPPPSFLTFPELENGKSDWVEIFTRDRARKISGHVFERFFFVWTLDPFFLAKTFFIGTRVLVSRTGPIELKFSPQVTIILPQNPFFLFQKISSPSVFIAEIRESFLETYISITKNPINFEGEVKIENKKKGFWGRVMTTSGENFSSIGPLLHTETLVPSSFAREKPFFEKNGKYCFTIYF